MSKQTMSEWKREGLEKLERFKRLLNKNEHSREELDELDSIGNKFGKHPMFIQASKDNYDARANSGWGGFGAPDCSCHISPPCQQCVDWTNFCEERESIVESGEEPGCVVYAEENPEHDCEAVRNPA